MRLSDLRGKVVALTFIYTRCPLPDFCPLMDRKFAELADRIGAVAGRAEHVRLLSVSFDPEHDTPEVLRKHAENLGARPPLWRFAVASHEELGQGRRPPRPDLRPRGRARSSTTSPRRSSTPRAGWSGSTWGHPRGAGSPRTSSKSSILAFPNQGR